MNSAKSGNLLMKAHQFELSNCKTIFIKPALDTRNFGVIHSRAIEEDREALIFFKNTNIQLMILKSLHDHLDDRKFVVFVDEVHFATKRQIYQLWKLAKRNNIDVFAYGLKVDYKNKLFEAAQSLEIYADTKEELKSMCMECSNKATTHLRLVDDIPVIYGESLTPGDIQGEERYLSLCQECREKYIQTYY